jgi:hypothetical protein
MLFTMLVTIMRLTIRVAFLALLLSASPVLGFSQNAAPVSPAPAAETAALTWKAALMAGDNQLDVFDNATRAMKSLFLRMGIDPANIRELSASSAERLRGALPGTAENLESALRGLAVGKSDACLVHLTSHGTRQGFFLRDSAVITPARLNAILDRGCGSQPTVVLISACYSGVFLDPVMTKPNRIILTAAAEDRTSFGCSAENQYTYWDGCLIDNLTQADSWNQLYGTVRRCVETKEAQRRFTPSLPRAFFGEAIANLRTPSALPSSPVTADGAGSSRCAVSTDNSYGMSANNPIKVGLDAATGPTRELQYLNALRGSAGQSLRFRRVGTTVVENVILDIYELSYEGLPSPVRLYLDGYHFEEPMAPLGFVCPISIGLKP